MPAPKSNKPSVTTPNTASRKAGGILVLNGPNLNLLGSRQPEIYGKVTLADVEASCRAATEEAGVALDFRQSNHEGELIDWVQQARGKYQAIIINAGGYSHTSVALMDALLLAEMPVYEVHVSNIYRREAFRHHSYISSVATGVLCGFGVAGYIMALYAAIDVIEASNPSAKNTQHRKVT